MVIKTEMKKMNDVELLKIYHNPSCLKEKENAIETLWIRYQSQIHNNWWKLQRQMNNLDMVNMLKDDYYSEAEEVFLTAISKIDLSKIEDNNFKCVGMLNWYLTNLRTKIIKTIKKTPHTKSISMMSSSDNPDIMTVDTDVETAYWDNEGYMIEPSYVLEMNETQALYEKIINECKKHWTDSEKEIFERMLEGKKKAEIIKSLNIESNEYNTSVRRIKNDLVRTKKRLCG